MASASPGLGSSGCATASFKFLPREGSTNPGISYVYDISGSDKTALELLVRASGQHTEAKRWLETNRVDFSAKFFTLRNESEIAAFVEKSLPKKDVEARSKTAQLRSSYLLQLEKYKLLKQSELGGPPEENSPFLAHGKEKKVELQTTTSDPDIEESRHVAFKETEAWDFSDVFVSSAYSKPFGRLDGCRVIIQEEDPGYSLLFSRPIEDGAALLTHRESLPEPCRPSIQFTRLEPGAASPLADELGRLSKEESAPVIGTGKGSAWRSVTRDRF